jgi:hypothetical protein
MTEDMPTVLPEESPVRSSAMPGVMPATKPSTPMRIREDQRTEVCSRVFQIVNERGMPDALAYAMCANAGAESAFIANNRQDTDERPDLTDAEYMQLTDGGTGYGLWQFDAGKKNNFHRWVTMNNLDYGIDSQINFVISDLTGELNKEINDGSDVGLGLGRDMVEALQFAPPENSTMMFARLYEKARPVVSPNSWFDGQAERRRRLAFLPSEEEANTFRNGPAKSKPIGMIQKIINKMGDILDTYPAGIM